MTTDPNTNRKGLHIIMDNWTTFKFSAKMSDTARAELEKKLPVLLESIGISEYNLDPIEIPTNESEV